MTISNQATKAQDLHSFFIRDVAESELRHVYQLNQSEMPHVSELSLMDLEVIYGQSTYFKVAMVEHEVAGFLVGMDADSDYESENYLYFQERYPKFFYIDRIAVGSAFRRRGIARALYDDASQFARRYTNLLTCEVNIRPANEMSMKFHVQYGFKEVGQQDTEGGKKRVSLLAKNLD